MKPPKKPSILDFFAPIARRPQAQVSANATPQSRGIADCLIAIAPSPPPDDLVPSTIDLSAAQLKRAAPTAPPVLTSTHAVSPDAQPPTTSQSSVNSGASKRVVSNGEQVVLNSDSDTDSLPELDFGVLTASFKTVTPTTRSKRTTEHEDDGLRKPEKRAKSRSRHFDQVIQTAKKGREVEQLVAEHKADLENTSNGATSADFVFNEDALGQVVQNDEDPDQAHRLFLAMQRTNATHVERVYHFFDPSQISPTASSDFPVRSLPEHRWTTSLRDATTRDQAFFTGFAHQVFRLQELPQELASWMVDEICLSRSDALTSKYLEILESNEQYLRDLLDRDRLNRIFREIGAKVPNTRSNAELVPDRVTVQNALEAILCNFIDNKKLIQGVGSPQLKDEARFLITSQFGSLLPHLLASVTHPLLQRDLVCALPATSPLTAYFRRHLALSFLLHPDILNLPLTDREIPVLVHKLLQNSRGFRINKETNYRHLTARIAVLDMAIGPGLLVVPYQPLASPAPSQPGSSPLLAPTPASDEVKEFNKVVDALAQHIKFLGNSIMEAGAVADLTILDAKDSVERLCARLEHAVRVGGKKAVDVFGNDDDGKQLKVTDIFRRAAMVRKTTPGSGIFDDDHENSGAISAQIEAENAT
ncbi:hypothetical protein DE146DRAFT_678036 [Phaeosphaeria sp. MPI-PUGE-AT-0046c]|nr:hypothetical protein DE146DRAFT_678036 [Phaeosphaeria sp. MPI-PUGE-AT-0046c]